MLDYKLLIASLLIMAIWCKETLLAPIGTYSQSNFLLLEPKTKVKKVPLMLKIQNLL